MKIIITEKQKKYLKKAITAQDQVGGKVNAGVMDAVVYGGGMCENVEDDTYELAPEKGMSPYYHVNEEQENDLSINNIIYSDNFKKWFGDWENEPQNSSKVVDNNGFPLVVHHGSPKFEGDTFNKEKIGQSVNYGEDGLFYTTQDLNWAERFSYPPSEGSSLLTVKLDTSKQGDILSGFLNLRHTLDLSRLSEEDIENIFEIHIKYDELAKDKMERMGEENYHQKFIEELEHLVAVPNHQTIKHMIHNNLGHALQEFGYDGLIADMGKRDGAKEYCFINPNQFKSIKNIGFNMEKDSIYEAKWNGDGEEWGGLVKPETYPNVLYHASPIKNRQHILNIGLYANAGSEYCDWWNYEGPNGEEPDDEDMPELVFLTERPYTWSDTYYLYEMDIFEVDMTKLNPEYVYLDPDRNMMEKGSFCYADNIPPSAIKLYDTVWRGKSINENVENELSSSEVDLSSFNIKKQLNPQFWDDGHLDSRIRMKLLDIADDFIEYLDVDWVKPKDIIMTGSLANFNWNGEYSDIDLHILMDFSDIDDNVELVKNYFLSKKSLWNDEHKGIKIYGFPVELYVQDVNEKHDSTGVYSLENDKWIIKPERDVLVTSKVNKNFIKEKVSDYANQIDKLVYLYKKNINNEYKVSRISDKANKLWDVIKNSRKKGFEKYDGREINNYNIIFKALRRFGYLDKLYKLRTKTYDILSSL